ncbi:thiopurine S-methyltransferase [Pseudoalteromonas sp. SR45-6]|uniref:thiopurine S-methyltransferase n=1 Tax=Pseudoalteromonas sp. SR45-6 TaxID=2760927 RepID=UPI0015FECEC6|nr:thiopurine S-methyltransferase [Pseudoalteromonas sp. SR45-6]MBB1340351.1 thiopurine S-methyltransferase [Pseudoalteromonas sp. SR45-6]
MQAEYWLKRWQSNDIGFHDGKVNPSLDRYFTNLNLPASSRVFIPLCGKTVDIHYLLNKGMYVVGVELSELAVRQLFIELALTPKVTKHGLLSAYQAQGICIWVGDVFALTADHLGHVDAIYDRGALVALPYAIRNQYAQHIITLSNAAPQLLITCVYDQSKRCGTPYSVSAAEIQSSYAKKYSLKILSCEKLSQGIKGVTPASIVVWLMVSKP